MAINLVLANVFFDRWVMSWSLHNKFIDDIKVQKAARIVEDRSRIAGR